MSDPDNKAGVAILVAVKTDAAKSVRVNVTLPEDVLAQIDKFAKERGASTFRLKPAVLSDGCAGQARA